MASPRSCRCKKLQFRVRSLEIPSVAGHNRLQIYYMISMNSSYLRLPCPVAGCITIRNADSRVQVPPRKIATSHRHIMLVSYFFRLILSALQCGTIISNAHCDHACFLQCKQFFQAVCAYSNGALFVLKAQFVNTIKCTLRSCVFPVTM